MNYPVNHKIRSVWDWVAQVQGDYDYKRRKLAEMRLRVQEVIGGEAGLIIHCHNPEGKEIGSCYIGRNDEKYVDFGDVANQISRYLPNISITNGLGVIQNEVSAWDISLHGRIIPVSAGLLTLNILFNGRTLTEEVYMLPGEIKELTYVFDRNSVDINSYLNVDIDETFTFDAPSAPPSGGYNYEPYLTYYPVPNLADNIGYWYSFNGARIAPPDYIHHSGSIRYQLSPTNCSIGCTAFVNYGGGGWNSYVTSSPKYLGMVNPNPGEYEYWFAQSAITNHYPVIDLRYSIPGGGDSYLRVTPLPDITPSADLFYVQKHPEGVTWLGVMADEQFYSNAYALTTPTGVIIRGVAGTAEFIKMSTVPYDSFNKGF